jgi:hypothetical protein
MKSFLITSPQKKRGVLVIDDYLPADLLKRCNESWPSSGRYVYGGIQAGKRVSDLSSALPNPCCEVLWGMIHVPSGLYPSWLAGEAVVPDLGLWGAGLHEMFPGSELPPHLDADHHPRLGLSRVLSSCLYTHERWESGWGGELVLGEGDDSIVIEPLPGRLVVFDCRGLRHEVRRVTGSVPRRSIALFWYGVTFPQKNRPRADFGFITR